MNIYFAGSIRGGRDDREIYAKIIRMLDRFGVTLTEHVGSGEITDRGEDLDDKYIYYRDVTWLKKADVVVAEVTNPSLGVGYEIKQAEELGIPILCLFRKTSDKRVSAMLSGNSRLVIKDYLTLADVEPLLNTFFREFFPEKYAAFRLL